MMESRLMGIDFGERKVGIAISDPLKIIAYPYKTIDRKKMLTKTGPPLVKKSRIISIWSNIFSHHQYN